MHRDPESGRALAQRIIAHGSERSWRHWECHGSHELFPTEPVGTGYWGHRLDLSPGYAALFAHFDESVRRAVRKAEKSGLTVEFSRELEAVRAFHQLLGLTRRRHGIPLQPFEFFRQIHRSILAPGLGFVALCRHESRPIAGAVFFLHGQAALYKFGASDERHQSLRGNNFVMARAIEKLTGDGYLTLDFGRTSLANEGLRHFKLSWATSERLVSYLHFSYKRNGFEASADRSTGRIQSWFRHAPVFLSRLVGRIIYKHIP
ncbi:MAG TPA: GNAT family N-acetyltransferase [Candidatus Didemnitutus sp.]|nr:GNAT family N-acetyltransferase [Candidatus Didemnitutus sp.]